MIKINNLLFVCFVAILFSCGSDDDPQPTGEGLPGQWKASSIAYTGVSITSTEDFEFEYDFTGKGKKMNLTLTFSEDPNTFTSKGDYTIALTTNMFGTSVTQDVAFEGFMSDGIWSLDGNTLTTTGDAAGAQQATIIELTATTLVMGWNQIVVQETEGVETQMVIEGTYTFKRTN